MGVDKLIWKIALDLAVLCCLGIPLLLLLLIGEPYHRGYYPNDESLRLPFKQQTISEGLLAGVGFVIIIITIVTIEFVRDIRGKGIGEKFLTGTLISGWLWESYIGVGVFTFGAACQQLTSNLAKYVLGRLRPHFFDICQPVPTDSALNSEWYVHEYNCTGTNASLLKDMRLSFPSAHASFAMYTAVFFMFYVQVKGKWRGSKLLRHGVQYLMVIAAWYVGLSRVVDHMHHWSDVAAGFAIGAIYGVLVFVYVLKPKKYGAPVAWHESTPTQALPRPVLAR